MTDDTTATTADPPGRRDSGRSRRSEDPARLLAEMRAAVEEAAGDIERLTAELGERSRLLEELEAMVDAVLAAADTPMIVVGEDRRLRAMSRGTAEVLDLGEPPVGRAASAVLPDEVMQAVTDALDRPEPGGEAEVDVAAGSCRGRWRVSVRSFNHGGAIIVLRRA